MFDPVADSADVDLQALAPRPEDLAGKRIGFLNNGKPAAKPTLAVVEDHIAENYPDASVERYDLAHLNRLKNDEELAAIEAWADEQVDVVIGALGDCGSCTKLLVYGINAVERSGTPAIGLIDEGFEIDWKSNRRDFGRSLRFHPLPALAEVTDEDRIREIISDDVFADIVTELTRPRSGEELAGEEPEGAGETASVHSED